MKCGEWLGGMVDVCNVERFSTKDLVRVHLVDDDDDDLQIIRFARMVLVCALLCPSSRSIYPNDEERSPFSPPNTPHQTTTFSDSRQMQV